MFHAYGVPRLWCCIKTQGKKGERLIAEKKEPEDWDLGPLQERLRMPHSAPGGGWRSLAELLRSLRMRTSANRLSRKFEVGVSPEGACAARVIVPRAAARVVAFVLPKAQKRTERRLPPCLSRCFSIH